VAFEARAPANDPPELVAFLAAARSRRRKRARTPSNTPQYAAVAFGSHRFASRTRRRARLLPTTATAVDALAAAVRRDGAGLCAHGAAVAVAFNVIMTNFEFLKFLKFLKFLIF
jgi:hypothetical protein